MKHIRRLLLALIIIALIIGAVFLCLKLQPLPGLLEQAGLPLSCVHGITDVESFTDWLTYTDGYDYAVLRVNPKTFTPPANWQQGSATIQEVNPAPQGLGCYDFHPDFYRNALLPESFTHWLFIPRDSSAAFDQQEFFAGMYDGQTGILVLYRGHTFHGSCHPRFLLD